MQSLVSVSVVPHQVLECASDGLLKELKVRGGTHYQLKKIKWKTIICVSDGLLKELKVGGEAHYLFKKKWKNIISPLGEKLAGSSR